MIRFFLAFLWLRWRLIVNSLRGGGDGAARLARWGGAIVQVVVPLLFVPVALGCGVLGWMAGAHLGGGGSNARETVLAVRMVLGIATAIVLLAPVLRSIHGSTTGRARFLLLPIPKSALLLCEIAAGLADPWIFILIPAMVLLPAGWAMHGSAVEALLLLATGGLLVAALLILSATAAFVVNLVVRDRKRSETLSLIVLGLIVLFSFVPLLLEHDNRSGGREKHGVRIELPDRAPGYVAWLTWVAPSELYGKVLTRAGAGSPAAGLLPAGALALVGGLLLIGSARVHRRLLDTPESSSGRRGGARRLRFPARTLPGVSGPAAALAWTTARIALRTVKGKVAFYSTPVGVALLAAPLSWRWEGVEFASVHIDAGMAAALIALVFPLVALQPILLNLYAVDRAGLTLAFLSPLSDDDLVRGKVAGGALLSGSNSALCLVLAALVTHDAPLSFWLMMVLGGLATHLVLGPVFAMLSALFPKASDLSSLGQRGNPNQLAALLGWFLTTAMISPIVILALAGHFLLGGWLGGLALMAGWVVLAGVLCISLLHLAAGLTGRRRETLALVAHSR